MRPDPYWIAPAQLRPKIKEVQDRAARLMVDADVFGMPHDTFDEICAERDRQIEELLNKQANLWLCPHCGTYQSGSHPSTCLERGR